MFDIGFWELLLIAIVMMLVVGPERMPEVARQIAFLVRKLRESLFRIRSEMKQELAQTPFNDINQAQHEMQALKNDIRQAGRDFMHSPEQTQGEEDGNEYSAQNNKKKVESHMPQQVEPNNDLGQKTEEK